MYTLYTRLSGFMMRVSYFTFVSLSFCELPPHDANSTIPVSHNTSFIFIVFTPH